MLNIGRVVVKTRGSDAGKVAVVIDVLDKNMVMIDGNVKRKKCNIRHLEPLSKTFEIKKGASTEEIKKLLEQHNLLAKTKKAVAKKRDRKKAPRPVRIRKKKEAAPEPKEKGKKAKKAPKISEDEAVESALAKV